jgi:hypothetical protein
VDEGKQEISTLLSTIVQALLVSPTTMFHRLILRSSLEMNVSPSEHADRLLMWYVWALAKVFLFVLFTDGRPRVSHTRAGAAPRWSAAWSGASCCCCCCC